MSTNLQKISSTSGACYVEDIFRGAANHIKTATRRAGRALPTAAFLALLALLVATTLVGAAAGATAGIDAAPQASNQSADSGSTSTSTETANATDTASGIIANVDGRVYVVGKRYNATTETFWVRAKNTGPTEATLTMTEAIDPSESKQSSRSFGIIRLTIDSGERTWVRVDARRVGRYAAVTVVTTRSIAQGNGAFIREDRDDDGGLLDGEATGGQVRSAGLGTLAFSVVMVVLGAWHWLAKSSNDVEDVDLGGSQ
jgi:hypothetical protein